MAELKTLPNDAGVEEFLNSVAHEGRRQDGFALLEMFREVTGQPPKMWGLSIVGFGMYHYKSEKSTQEGDWPLVAFSPRKQNLTLYVMPGFDAYQDLLKDLGKYKTSVACLYLNKLADVDLEVLKKIIKRSYLEMKKQYS